MRRTLLTLLLGLALFVPLAWAGNTDFAPTCTPIAGGAQSCEVTITATTGNTGTAYFPMTTASRLVNALAFTCIGTWSSGNVKPYVTNNGSTFSQVADGNGSISCTDDTCVRVGLLGTNVWTNFKLVLSGATAGNVTCTVTLN